MSTIRVKLRSPKGKAWIPAIADYLRGDRVIEVPRNPFYLALVQRGVLERLALEPELVPVDDADAEHQPAPTTAPEGKRRKSKVRQ